MAYKKLRAVIAPGGLNLAAPTDLTGDDSIALLNWRTDRDGSLRSRLTQSSVAAGFIGFVNTIYRHGQLRYYASTAGELYRTNAATVSATGFDGEPLGLCSYQGYLWVMNRAKQGRETGSGFETWLPAAPSGLGAPSAIAGGSLVDDVEYTYWVTYVTADGQETGESNSVTFTPVAGSGDNTAQITRPASADARITAGSWRVYRIGNTLEEALRVAEITYGTATFDDTGDGGYSDLEVSRNGFALEFDHDDAPACRGLLDSPYNERLVMFNSATYTNRIWYTNPRKPWYVPAANYVDLGDGNDEIVQIKQHPGHLRIYMRRSVWRLVGDFETGRLERVNADIGLIGAKAIDSYGGLDYFQAQEGIYASNGDGVRCVSSKLTTLFREGVTFAKGSNPITAAEDDETIRAKACLAVRNGRLRFSYAKDGSTSNDQILVCNLATENWHTEDTPVPLGLGAYALYYEGQYNELLASFAAGTVYALEVQAATENKALQWCSGFRDQGYRDRQKKYSDVVIEHSVKYGVVTPRSLTVKAYFNNENSGTNDVALGSINVAVAAASGEDRAVVSFPISTTGKEARNMALFVEGNCEQEVVLFSSAVHYYIEPRDAHTFDTSLSDLGYPGLKSFTELELEILPGATVTWTLYTDLPGNTIASRATGTITTSAERLPIPLPLACEGRRVQLILTCSAGTFRLYNARIRYRPIGVYLDGTKQQIWQTQDIPLLFVS